MTRLCCGFFVLASLLTRKAALKERKSSFSSGRERRRRGKHGNRFATIGVLLLLSTMLCGAARGEEPVYYIDIPSMDAAQALNRFAEQTGAITLFSYDLASARRANAVRGRYTLLQGLDLLLRDTGLSGGLSDKRVVNISHAGNAQRPGEETAMPKEKASFGKRITAFITSILAAAAASGQDGETGSQAIEEIIVTAQKRVENLQDVPISLTALTGEELDRGTVTGVTDALRSVPGIVTLEDRNGMGASIAVRGVGGGSLFNGSSAPIAYYLDSVPFGLVRTAFVPDSTAYDLERVEVLRGPQGTLYGAAALNGVIRVLTKEVDLNDRSFKARGMTSSGEYGGWNYRADAAANLPIVQDKLAVRVTAGYQDFSGWIDRAVRGDANDSEIANVRVKLKAQPTESLTIGLSAWISRADYGAPSTGDENRNHSSLIEEPIAADYDVYALNLNYDFGPVSLTSSTSYLDFNSSNTLDYAPFCCANAAQINDLNSEVFSEELLLSSTGDGPWRWSIGGLFRDVKDESVYLLRGLVPGPLGFDDASKSTAIFGEVTRLFLDGKLELTGGLRHFKDRVKTRDNSPGGTLSARDTFTYTSPRGVLTWHLNDAAMIYASYSKGFRSGVLQTPEITAAGFPSADPDTLANYEIGAKTDLFDRRLTLEVAGYFIDWQNVQQDITVPINGTLYRGIVNGPSASGFGADVSMVVRPIDALSLGASLSLNDLTMDADVYTTTRIGNGPPFQALYYHKGDRLNLSPKRTLGGFAQYEFPLTEGGFSGVINISARQTPSMSFPSLRAGVLSTSSSDKQTIGRASFSLRAPAAWDATLFVDNFTNEQGITLPYKNPSVPSWEPRPRPRTVGLQVDYRF